MASLTGQTIQSTYDGLLKTSDSDAITSSLKRITDGLGNFTPLYLSTTAVEVSTALTATSFIRTGGTSSQFLKADGSVDSTTYTPTSRTLTINGETYDLSANRSWTIAAGVTSFNTRTGAITLTSGDVTGALGYTPYNATNPAGYISGITSGMVTSALGYTPVPNTRTLTINGTTFDLTADRSWTITAGVSGSGTPSRIAMFTSGSTVIGNSQIFQSIDEVAGTMIGIGGDPNAAPILSRLYVNGTSYMAGSITATGAISTSESITASSIVRSGGTSAQLLAANGSVVTAGTNITISGGTISASGGLSGSLTTNFIPKATGATSLGNSLIFDDGTNVGIATSTPSSIGGHTGVLTIFGSNATAISLQDSVGRKDIRLNDGNLDITNSAGTSHLYVANAGGVGIGSTTLTGFNLNIARNLTGAVTSRGIQQAYTVQSDVTNAAIIYSSGISTQATAFTLPQLTHYFASQGAIGAGSTVTNQNGFRVDNTLIGATNNYAFKGEVPAGANRWNLFMDGTANNHLAGSLAIGTTATAAVNLNINKAITGSTTSYGMAMQGAIQSDVTANARLIWTNPSTQATTFTLNQLVHYFANQGTFGAGSTVNVQNGFLVESTLIGATNNYGFRGIIPAGTGRWNLYMDGTANNYLEGNTAIGTTTPFSSAGYRTLTVGGGAGILGQIVWNSGTTPIGYAYNDSTNMNIGSNADLIFRTTGSATERMRITSAGNVGINTTSPSYRLHVVGTAYFNPATDYNVLFQNSGTTLRMNYLNDAGSANISAAYRATDFAWQKGDGAETMRITSGGDVAIGTSSIFFPAAGRTNLIVNGGTSSIFALGVGNSYAAYLYAEASRVELSTATQPLAIVTNGSERMRITSGGNVGIGTSSPATRTHFVGGSTTTSAANAATTVTSRFDVANPAISLGIGYVSTDIPMIQGFNNGTNNATNLTINPFGGNVGIGITNPGVLLHSNPASTTNLVTALFTNGTSDSNFKAGFANGSGSSAGTEHAKIGMWYGTSGNPVCHIGLLRGFSADSEGITFNVNNTERMRITSGGNVGIGTTTADSRLHVLGTFRTVLTSGAGGQTLLSAISGVSNGYLINVDTSNNITHTWHTGANNPSMHISSGGNVGIGTTAPGYRLDVVGTIYASGDVLAFSDISVKENIRPIDNALERVLNSRGVVYDRIDNEEKDNIGFIAQELEVNFPELVSTKPDGTKSVKYQNAVAILFEAIKQQQAQIDELKKLLN